MNSNWFVEPTTIIDRNSSVYPGFMIDPGVEFYGFVDGAYSQYAASGTKAGIGEYLNDKHHNLVYLFSGPSKVECPLHAELEAIKQLLTKIYSSNHLHGRCLIFLDCESLTRALSRIKIGLFSNLFPDALDFKEMISNVNVEFRHVNRILNSAANALAKQGLNRNDHLEAWC